MTSRISHELPIVAAVAATFSILLSIFWVGFIASDDAIYLAYAHEWIAGEFRPPSDHWGFRFTMIGPLAIALSNFGDTPYVIGAVAASYGAVLIGTVYLLVRRWISPTAAAIAAFITATTPFIVVDSSILNVDVPEILFGIISIGLFVQATQSDRPVKFLVASGVLAGIAFLNRETASGLILAYFILFLSGAFFERKVYLWGALGALCVLGVESLFYVALGESPFVRFYTLTHSHGTFDLSLNDVGSTTGNVSTNRIFGPIIALLVNQEFGLLYFFAAPASWSLLRNRSLPETSRTLVQVLFTVMLVWILWTSYNGAIPPAPRYYSLATLTAVLLVSFWLYYIPNAKTAVTFGALLVLGSLAALSIENTHPRFVSRTLAEFVETAGEPVHTDVRTYRRAKEFLQWSSDEVQARISKETPPDGALYFYNPNIVTSDRHSSEQNAGPWMYENSELLRGWEPPKRVIGHILVGLGLDGLLPGSLRDRIVYCSRSPQSYRVAR